MTAEEGAKQHHEPVSHHPGHLSDTDAGTVLIIGVIVAVLVIGFVVGAVPQLLKS